MGGTLTVPYPFDVIIDSQGYLLADQEEQKAAFGLSPVYVSRQNTQGNYGDNQQDFWLTFTQKDWSEGEGQRYQGRDEEGAARYYFGTNVDVSVPGEVSQRKQTTSLSFAANPVTACTDSQNDRVWAATSTTLYHVIYDGTITSVGAHGLGAAPSRFASVHDGGNVFLSTTTAGTVGVRRWNGTVFSTFSATAVDALAFLNNSLYGYSTSTAQLVRYDTAGAATTLYTWTDAAGNIQNITAKLVPFGGKLLILRYRSASGRGPEIWQFDGTNTTKLSEFPANFNAYDMEVLNGTVFVSGALQKHSGATVTERPTIYFYKDGAQDVLWQANIYATSPTTSAVAAHDRGLIWQDRAFQSHVMYYDATSGGVSRRESPTFPTTNHILVSAATFFLTASTGTTSAFVGPISTGVAAGSSFVYTSLIDFDSSLRKIFRGVRVEFDAATDGNGGTVDIAYSYDTIDSGLNYTSLQTGAVSGTEYKFSTPAELTNYRSVSIRVTLNKGTSTNGPVLRRIQVRAVPVTPAFKTRTYVLSLGGRDGDSPQTLRDGAAHALDGLQMATNLQTAGSRSSPFSVTDHLGTFTGVVEDLNMVEVKPEEFVATVKVREV